MNQENSDSVQQIIEIYAKHACSTLESYTKYTHFMFYSEFYRIVNKAVSEETGLFPEDVSIIGRPFKWVLFDSKNPIIIVESGDGIRAAGDFPKASDLAKMVSDKYYSNVEEILGRINNSRRQS